MKAFDKILKIITNSPQNGHALRNIENKESLTKAKKEIELMLKSKEKGK